MPASAGIAPKNRRNASRPPAEANAYHREIRSRGAGSTFVRIRPRKPGCRREWKSPTAVRIASAGNETGTWLFYAFFGGHVICSCDL